MLLRLIADAPPKGCHTWLLGGTAMRCAANAAGLSNFRHLPLPYANALLGLPALRYALAKHPKPDVLHCWTRTTLTAARWLMPLVPRVFMSSDVGLNLELLKPTCREPIRRAWGAGPTSHIVALLGDADTYHAMLATAIASESMNHDTEHPVDLRLLVLPRQRNRPHARQMLDGFGQSRMLIQDSRLALPWDVLPACDAALILEDRPPQLATRWAMLAGTPIVAQTPDAASELLAHDQTALLSPTGDLRTLAHHLTQVLQEDRPGAHTRAAEAQQKIIDTNSLPRFHASLDQAYHQAIQDQLQGHSQTHA